MSDKRRSGVWLYFNAIDSNKAKCDICKNVLSYKGGATCNLRKHLKAKHFAVITQDLPSPSSLRTSAELEEVPEPSTSSTSLEVTPGSPAYNATKKIDQDKRRMPFPSSKQSKISTFATRPMSIPRTKNLHIKVLNMIIKDMQPFTIVEDEGFRELLEEFDPAYKLPSRKTLCNRLLPQTYDEVVQKVKNLLENSEYLTITTDTWTSTAVENYLAITVHYLNDEWKLISILLDCCHFPDQHTAENLRNQLLNTLQEWNISEKVHTAVTDNARNITAAIKLTGWTHLPCLAHTLNLVVQDGIKLIQPIHKKVKRIVEYFHHSTTAKEKLSLLQVQLSEKNLKLINDVVTRWNSTYFMFQRMCEIQTSLEAAIGVLHSPVDSLNAEEWKILQEFCLLLKPFNSITIELSAEKTVTISKIIPMVEGLKQYITGLQNIESEVGLTLKEELLRGLSTRFSRLEYNPTLAKSTFLDPRFKGTGFSDNNAFSKIKDAVINEVSQVLRKINQEKTVSPNNSDSNEKEDDSVWAIFDKKMQTLKHTSGTETSSAIIEIRQYCEEINLRRRDDPLTWWKSREAVYPVLSKLAKKYLSIVGTSVPSERVFSKAGQLVSERRSRLKPKNVKSIVFLNANHHLL